MKIIVYALLGALMLPAAASRSAPTNSVARVPLSSLERGLEWRGVALEEKDYTLWDVSPIVGDDGRVHLFVGRWPEKNVDPGWRKSSEIAHYVGDKPEGPFRFCDVALRGTGTNTWDRFAPSNPEIHKFGDTYALLYIANNGYHQPPHPRNQRIGMAISQSLDGPWRKVGRDGLLLEPSSDPDHWTYGSQVVNPTLVQVGGKFHLYFKSQCQGLPGTVYGVAIADQLEGPYHITGEPLTTKGITIEDGFIFSWQGKVCLISTDNHGGVTGIRGGGALWVSDDSLKFNPAWTQVAYDRIPAYYRDYDPLRVKKIYGGDPKLERPKLLMENGQPAWLYAPSGWNVTGGERTVIHLLRINLKPGDGPLPAPVRVACLGDSITFGTGVSPRDKFSYPAQLGALLGDAYDVRNFGVGSTTLLVAGDKPYRRQPEFQMALKFNPDFVLVMLGVNDTCSVPRGNWEKSDAFVADARALLQTLHQPGRRVIVSLPPAILPATPGLKAERRADLEARAPRLEQIRGWWREAARAEEAEVLDLSDTLNPDPRLVVDGVHPTGAGYERIVRRYYERIAKNQPRATP